MNRRHSIVLAAAASCAATLLVGGITWAAIPGDGGVINACYGKIGGVVRVIDTAKREKCSTALEVPLSWNQEGQKGDPGTPGAPGTNGVDGKSPTVAQLAAGDLNCPAGGAAIKDAAGTTAYVCSGEPFSGTFTSPSGEYSISVTDGGISLIHGDSPVVNITGQDIAIVAEHDTRITIGRNLATSTAANAWPSTTGGTSNATVGGGVAHDDRRDVDHERRRQLRDQDRRRSDDRGRRRQRHLDRHQCGHADRSRADDFGRDRQYEHGGR